MNAFLKFTGSQALRVSAFLTFVLQISSSLAGPASTGGTLYGNLKAAVVYEKSQVVILNLNDDLKTQSQKLALVLTSLEFKSEFKAALLNADFLASWPKKTQETIQDLLAQGLLEDIDHTRYEYSETIRCLDEDQKHVFLSTTAHIRLSPICIDTETFLKNFYNRQRKDEIDRNFHGRNSYTIRIQNRYFFERLLRQHAKHFGILDFSQLRFSSEGSESNAK